jgi:inhibitor of cysteine peptidase
MKGRWIVMTVVACVAAVTVGCSGSRALLGPESDGESVRVGIGQVVEVALPSNPSTGYSWQVVEVPEFLVQTGPAGFESEAEPDVVGAGGTELLRFEVSASGSGALRLEYRRPWESDAPAREVFEVEVTAR